MIKNQKVGTASSVAFSIAVMLAAAFALIFAYTSQLLGHHPCKLCYYQRVPYFLIALLALSATLVSSFRYKNLWKCLVAICLVVEIVIAFFHFGVEMGWFTFHSSCANDLASAGTFEEFQKMLIEAEVVQCNVPTFVFLGFSMAFWNAVYATTFLVVFSYFTIKGWRK